jgi:hypothetical protein
MAQQADERIRVVDIFDEVEEDLRAERAEKLLKKYAGLLVAVAVAIVAAAASWQLWMRYQKQQDASAASAFVAGQATGDLKTLDELAATGPEGYKTLARLTEAGLKAKAGDLQGAESLWNAVASDSSADTLLRDFASLMAAGHELDHGDPAELASRLKPLALPSNPWSSLAREQLALLALRQGKQEDARQMLQALMNDIAAPSGLRARVSGLLAGVDSPDGKR